MKTGAVLACVMAVICLTGSAYAIEGGAVFVDTLGAEASSFDDVGSFGGSLVSEVAVRTPGEDWAVIAGINYKSVDPEAKVGNDEGWGGVLGVKYYFTRVTSLALLGSFDEYDYIDCSDVTAGTLAFEQRFLPARSGVSPCMNAALGMRSRDYELGGGEDNNSTDYIIKLGAGCDFMITDTLAIVFDVEYCGILDSLSNLDDMDNGVIGKVSFTSYWD